MYKIDEIRKMFPMLNNKTMQGKTLVYLDNASTTFKPQCVIDAMNKYYLEETSNSHRGDYDLLYHMDVNVEEARKTISNFINCDTKEVVFTSGDTMSLNIIAWGYGRKFLNKDDEILISEAEHASNSIPWFEISKITGSKVKFIPLDKTGHITLDNLKKTLTKNTKIVSLAHISNVLGNIVDVEAFAKEIHKVGAIFVVDGAQSVPHLKTDFKKWDIDFLTFSGHKMCGPTGIGCLIGKYGLLNSMDNLLTGGGMNVSFNKDNEMVPYDAPMKFEAGTLNLAGIMGLKTAVEFLSSIGMDNIHTHEVELKKYLLNELKKLDNIIIYNDNLDSGILTFNIKNVFAQDEATLLNSKGIAVRSGQHCAKMLNDYLCTPATARMSMYLYTSKEEIDYFIKCIKEGGDILDAYFN